MALRVSSFLTTHTHHLFSIDEDSPHKMALRPEDSPPRFAPLTRQLSGLGAKLGNVFGGGARDDSSSLAMSDSETLAGGEQPWPVVFFYYTFLFLSTDFLVVVVVSRVPGRDKGASRASRDKHHCSVTGVLLAASGGVTDKRKKTQNNQQYFSHFLPVAAVRCAPRRASGPDSGHPPAIVGIGALPPFAHRAHRVHHRRQPLSLAARHRIAQRAKAD